MLPLSIIGRYSSILLHALLPPACFLCGRTLPASQTDPDIFCRSCTDEMPAITSPCCPKCSLPYAATEGKNHLCEGCIRNPAPFSWAAAAGLYDHRLRQAIRSFKFSARLDLDRPLGSLIVSRMHERLRAYSPESLIAVPLYSHRLRQRTFNQSYLLARRIGHLLHVPVDSGALVQTRPSTSQKALSADRRRGNLQGVFETRGSVAGKRLLLVDDVITTGATIAECSRVLLKAGAKEVAVVAAARAPRFITANTRNPAS